MEIFYKKKKLTDISNLNDLESFIVEYKVFILFRKIPKDYHQLINDELIKTEKLNFKEFKKWYRNILKYPETIYNKQFLFSMGWEISEIENFIKNKQKENSKILASKKYNNPELYYEKSPKRTEYWISKGYTENDAKKIISNSQRTFSKEICIKKYGTDKGLDIFNTRQKKWIKTLYENNNMNEVNKKKNPFLSEKRTINQIIQSTSFLDNTKEIITECINCGNIKEFILCILDKVDVKTLSDIIPFINSSIISNHYGVTRQEIKNGFYDLVSHKLKTGLYGSPVYHNGIRFKSVKEYKISTILESHKIKYNYEVQYPNSSFKCDFYLPDYNIYIEYFGILDKKCFENLDERQLKYYDKMIKKILFCEENNLKLIYDTDFTKLYNKILNII